jgi:peptidoglycan/LPS O-acetylase OafA/YrhL
MPKKHLYSLDMLRGLVAVLVCLYHFTQGFLDENHIIRTLFSRGYLGVEIFFVISGFVIPFTMFKSDYEYKDAGSFMLRRLARIEPPYWCSIALIFIGDYLSTFFHHYKDKIVHIDWNDVILHVFHLNDFLDKPWLRGIYWSLAIEVQYYLLMAIIFPFLIFKNKKITYLLLFAFCMGRWIDLDYLVFYYGCHFVAGMLLFNHHIGKISSKELWISLILTAALTFWSFDIYHFTAVVSSVLFIYFLDYMIPPLVFLGKISYSFYLIHIQIGWVALDALIRSFPEANVLSLLVISVFIALAGSYLFYLIIEKPSHNLARKINN